MADSGKAIVLIGFMGVGKSSVGQALAGTTGWPLHDTDRIVSVKFGMPIDKIFSSHSEDAFREAESEVLNELPELPAIIATGGGIVLRANNVLRMKRLGTVVYLRAEEETLFDRVSLQDTRPLLKGENTRVKMVTLLRDREPLYRAAADLTFDTTTQSATEVAELVLRAVQNLASHVA